MIVRELLDILERLPEGAPVFLQHDCVSDKCLAEGIGIRNGAVWLRGEYARPKESELLPRRLPAFDVIDLRTGSYPDVEKIALGEEWAKNLVYCDIDTFAVTEDGRLILIDDCGNIAYCPAGRFEIVKSE